MLSFLRYGQYSFVKLKFCYPTINENKGYNTCSSARASWANTGTQDQAYPFLLGSTSFNIHVAMNPKNFKHPRSSSSSSNPTWEQALPLSSF